MKKKTNDKKTKIFAWIYIIGIFFIIINFNSIFYLVLEFLSADKGRISVSYVIGGLITTFPLLFIANKLAYKKNIKLLYSLILLIVFLIIMFWFSIFSCTGGLFCGLGYIIYFFITVFIGGYFILVVSLNIFLKWLFDKYNFFHKNHRNYFIQSLIIFVTIILVVILMMLQGII